MPEGTNTTRDEKRQKEILADLRRLGGKGLTEDDIVHEGTRFILPQGLTDAEALSTLQKKIDSNELNILLTHTFPYRPWDGAAAMARAFQRTFGMVIPEPRVFESMFGSTVIPPTMHNINIGVNETISVPWGMMASPILPGVQFEMGADEDTEDGEMQFALRVTLPGKYRHEVEGIFKLIDDELRTGSIYRGKALDGADMPNFIDLSKVDASKVIYNDQTQRDIEANVWSLLTRTEAMRQAGLPLKRAVLLAGEYGTGKTLTAHLTAQYAVQHGWTFFYVRPGLDNIHAVMQTARMYQPSVVFVEDIDMIPGVANFDAVGDGRNRVKRTAMLDLFDGINAKGAEIVVVATTNHVERITPAMMRPGRFDAVVQIGVLDKPSIERLLRANMSNGVVVDDGTLDYEAIAAACQNYPPAFVKEVGDQAVRYALARGADPHHISLTTEDYTSAANGLRAQFILSKVSEPLFRIGNGAAALEDALERITAGAGGRGISALRIG